MAWRSRRTGAAVHREDRPRLGRLGRGGGGSRRRPWSCRARVGAQHRDHDVAAVEGARHAEVAAVELRARRRRFGGGPGAEADAATRATIARRIAVETPHRPNLFPTLPRMRPLPPIRTAPLPRSSRERRRISRRLHRSGRGRAPSFDQPHRGDPAGAEGAVGIERGVEDRRGAEDARGVEVVEAAEVAEAVGDQAAAVDLHPAQDVRAGAEHQVGARAHRHPGELARVAAVLAEVVLLGAGDVLGAGALGAGVDRDDDDLRAARGAGGSACGRPGGRAARRSAQ